MMITDSERKLQKLFDKSVNEDKKKNVTINCKTEYMIVNKKDNLRCELRIENFGRNQYKHLTV